jgi:hypothetical protein
MVVEGADSVWLDTGEWLEPKEQCEEVGEAAKFGEERSCLRRSWSCCSWLSLSELLVPCVRKLSPPGIFPAALGEPFRLPVAPGARSPSRHGRLVSALKTTSTGATPPLSWPSLTQASTSLSGTPFTRNSSRRRWFSLTTCLAAVCTSMVASVPARLYSRSWASSDAKRSFFLRRERRWFSRSRMTVESLSSAWSDDCRDLEGFCEADLDAVMVTNMIGPSDGG